MSEEIKEAIKLFDREDLLNDYGIQDTDTNIEVFLSVKDMIKYYKQGKEIERLHKIIEIKNKRIQQLMKRTRSARIDKAINYITKQMKKYEGYDRDFEIVLSNIVVILGDDKE